MANLDDFFAQQFGEKAPRPTRRSAGKTGVTEQYRKFEARFDEWASGQFDKWCKRDLEACARHVYYWYLRY